MQTEEAKDEDLKRLLSCPFCSSITEQEIEALQTTKLDRETPFVICGVSRSQFSIARFYGGCKVQGRNYIYIPTTDELLRDDVVKWLAKHRKAQRKIGGDSLCLFA